jgi:hypothetical protein
MILDPDSPLRKLPANLDMSQKLSFNGISYSVEMIELAYFRLRETLFNLTQNQQQFTESHDLVVSALFDAWSIIDSIHRLRSLLLQTRNLKQKSPGVQLFLRRTENVIQLRNTFQHLDQQIKNYQRHQLTVWGSLSWFVISDDRKSGKMCTLIPGTLFAKDGHPLVNPAGKEILPPVDLITLTAAGCVNNIFSEKSISLSDFYKYVYEFIKDIEVGLKEQTKGLPTAANEMLLVATIEFNDTN